MVEDLGDVDALQRQKSGVSLDYDEDAVRCSGTPTCGPKSPSRQLALANLGLMDDLDLGDECVDQESNKGGADIDRAFDEAAKPEAPPDLVASLPRNLLNLATSAEVPVELPAGSPDEEEEDDESGSDEEDDEDD